MEFNVISMLIIFIVLLNIIMTVYISRKEDLSSFQKKGQVLIIWIIPVFAAIGLWVFHRSQNEISNNNILGGGSSCGVDVTSND